jgi:quercetin dioxygenase-like cupin family protein
MSTVKKSGYAAGPGDTLIAPMNALHAFHNRTEKPSRFISSSVYYHEVLFKSDSLKHEIRTGAGGPCCQRPCPGAN